MLSLSRLEGQRIRLSTSDGPIWLEVLDVRGLRVNLGITAPAEVVIEREEIIGQQPRKEKENSHVVSKPV